MLTLESPTYLRRLVRELNTSAIDGFYAPVATMTVRCNRARMRNGNTLEVRSPACSPEWFVPSATDRFVDIYGRSIVASRR